MRNSVDRKPTAPIAAGTTPEREDMTLGDDESVAGWLERWDEVAARTDAFVATGENLST